MSTVLQEFLKRTSKGFIDKTFNEFMSKHVHEEKEEDITNNYKNYQNKNTSSPKEDIDKPTTIKSIVDLSPKSTKNGDISIEIEDLDSKKKTLKS